MKAHRIYAIFLRYMYLMRRSYDRMSDLFYWPTVDLVIWGLTSSYFASLQTENAKLISMLLGSLLLWMIVWRTQYEISVNLLEELWNKNLTNIFVSPISFYEWIASFYLLGIVKSIISVSFAGVLGLVFYHLNFLQYSYLFLIYIPILVMTGWTFGMIIASFILKFGTRVQTLAWSLPYLLSPLAAIYYPIETLPNIARQMAFFVPISHVFESGRMYLSTGSVDFRLLGIGFGLSLLYLVFATVLLKRSFDSLLNKGLVNVY